MSDDAIQTPLKEWRIRRFKGVREATVPLKPLTMLVGANSSGKTTLIQSIVLLAQATHSLGSDKVALNGHLANLGDFDNLRHRPTQDATIEIGGAFVFSARSRVRSAQLARRPFSTRNLSLGERSLPELRVNWDVALEQETSGQRGGAAALKSVEFKAEERTEGFDDSQQQLLPGPTRDPWLRISYRGQSVKEPVQDDAAVPRLGKAFSPGPVIPFDGRLILLSYEGKARRPVETTGLSHRAGLPLALYSEVNSSELILTNIFKAIQRAVFSTRRSRPERRPRQQSVEVTDVRSSVGELSLEEITSKLLRALQSKFTTLFPAQSGEIFVDLMDSRELAAQMAAALSPNELEALSNLPPDAEQQLRRRLMDVIGRGHRVQVDTSDRFMPVEDLIRASSRVHELLSRNVHYLGPLRQDPQVLYGLSQSTQPGFVGTKGEHTVSELNQHGASKVYCPRRDEAPTEMPLQDALNYWLREFGLADAATPTPHGRFGLELLLRPAETSFDLDITLVGIGLSQILPVLVMALRAEPGSVILLEQPELHLHPAMQQKLGDFLLACAESGRQLIVETHSDHLVSRLRRRIAEATEEQDHLLSTIGFVFVEQLHGESHYRTVIPDRFGGFEDWPAGFFDQSAGESRAILEAGLKKRLASGKRDEKEK